MLQILEAGGVNKYDGRVSGSLSGMLAFDRVYAGEHWSQTVLNMILALFRCFPDKL